MSRHSAPALLGLLLIAATPAGADWLVTRAGGRVETRGPWQVKGRLVVFTQTDGSLASLRLADVDLEASREASEGAKAQARKPAPPEPVKKKLAVLTDKDFKKAPPADKTAAATPRPDAPAAPTAPAASSGPVTVSSWKRVDLPDGTGLEVQGTLQNATGDLVVNAAVEVQLYNEAGERVGTASAILATSSIQPNGTTEFRASFPGLFTFADVKFDPRGLPLALAPAPDPKPEN